MAGVREAGVGGLGDICAGDLGVDDQYGIGLQASSAMAAMAALILGSCRTVIEKRTSSVRAVSSTACEWNAESARTVRGPLLQHGGPG